MLPAGRRENMDGIAYLDAGSGSMLLQALVGGLAAVGVFGRLFLRRIKSGLRLGRKPAEQPER